MLQIPQLKPGQEPYDPTRYYTLTNNNAPAAQHTLSLGLVKNNNAIPLPGADSRQRKFVGQREDKTLDSILDHAVVKDLVTELHKDDVIQTQKLMSYSGSAIGTIVSEQKKFIATQKNKYLGLLSSERQRGLLQLMTQNYFDDALQRAQQLQAQSIYNYRNQVCERQNEELLKRALLQENLVNDVLQTQYRDMILFNVDTLLEDTPETQRQQRLTAVSHLFYTRIIDARFEYNPDSIQSMLASPVVVKIIGAEEIEKYRTLVRAAAQTRELETIAQKWVENGIDPMTAKQKIKEEFTDPDTQKVLREKYAQFRYRWNQGKYLKEMVALEQAWQQITAADFILHSIPQGKKERRPELWQCITVELQLRESLGGIIPDPDYLFLCALVADFDPHVQAERLADPKAVYTLVQRLHGPDSPAFQAMLRLLLGKLEASDQVWFRDLLYARKEFALAYGEDVLKTRGNEFLTLFTSTRNTRLVQSKAKELDMLSVHTLVGECITAFI